jgi:hypothetical protein
VVFSDDFEGRSVGPLSGQAPWADGAGTTPPTVVTAPDPVEGTKAVRMEINDTQGETSYVDWPTADLVAAGYKIITVSYDIYRPAPLPGFKAQNFWWWWFDSGTPTYGLQWDIAFANGGTLPFGFEAGAQSVPTVYGTWTPLVQVWDLVGHKATSYYNGQRVDAGFWVHDIATLTGWGLSLSHDAATGASGGPTLVFIDNFTVKGFKTGGGGGSADNGYYQMNPIFGQNRGYGGLFANQTGDSIVFTGTSNELLTSRIAAMDVTALPLLTAAPPQIEQPHWFYWDTGVSGGDPALAVTGGPILGPTPPGGKQHIYYFRGDTGELVALTFYPPVPGDFDGDRSVDATDYGVFAGCWSGSTVPFATGCAPADLDGDNDVDEHDFGLFQRCYTGTGVIGNPDCTGLP